MFEKQILALLAFLHVPESHRNKGFIQIVMTVIGVVIVGVVLLINPIILGQVDDAAPTLTGIANSSYESVATGIFNALNMTTIIPTVMIAGAIITILLGSFVVLNRQ